MSIEDKVLKMRKLYSNIEVKRDEDTDEIKAVMLALDVQNKPPQLYVRYNALKSIVEVFNKSNLLSLEITNTKIQEQYRRTAEQFKNDWDSIDGSKAKHDNTPISKEESHEALKAVMGEPDDSEYYSNPENTSYWEGNNKHSENIKEAAFKEVGPQKQVETPKVEPKRATKKQDPVVIPEVEEVDRIIPATLPVIVGMGIVRPAVTAAEALAAWKEFQALKKAILEPSDLQRVQGKDCIKKSGWRKFATFYNLTDKIVEETKIQMDDKEYIWKIKVICTAANGRQTEGVAMCSSKEKSGPRQMHDTYSTCHTRAKNRAISDMIAAGEVSAEEME